MTRIIYKESASNIPNGPYKVEAKYVYDSYGNVLALTTDNQIAEFLADIGTMISNGTWYIETKSDAVMIVDETLVDALDKINRKSDNESSGNT